MDEVEVGEDVKIEITWDNAIDNAQTYVLEMTLQVPSGWSVSQHEGVSSSGGGRHTGQFEIPPGKKRTLTISAQASDAGEHRIEMTGSYFPRADSSQKHPVSLSKAIKVTAPPDAPPASAPAPEQSAPTQAQPTAPGYTIIVVGPTPVTPDGGNGGCNSPLGGPSNPMAGAGEMAIGAFMLSGLWMLSRRNRRRK